MSICVICVPFLFPPQNPLESVKSQAKRAKRELGLVIYLLKKEGRQFAMPSPLVIDAKRFLAQTLGHEPQIQYITVGFAPPPWCLHPKLRRQRRAKSSQA